VALPLIPSDATMRPRDVRGRLSDGAGMVLKLFVNGGSRCWCFDYPFEGRRNTLSFGSFPTATLSDVLPRALPPAWRRLCSS